MAPRRQTRLTAAGRSQLLAYLLHDAVFSVGAQVVAPTLPALAWHEHTASLIAATSATAGAAGGAALTAVLAAAELALYASLCLMVQLCLSHPRGCLLGWRTALCCGRAPPPALSAALSALSARARLGVRHMMHARGVGAARRGAAEESTV